MHHRIPVSSWSKAPWGLSVLAQVTSIFTGISISPGALSRQRSNHYAFRDHRIPVSSWSKAPWGLSVLAQVTSIFTGISISPGALSRQRSNHYAFRAGRNLPDKALVFQFHRVHCRDSAQIITPFVRVGTYPTRNFATLGPL